MSSDSNTDLKDHIIDWGIGLWNQSGDIKKFIENYKYLSIADNRKIMRENSYRTLTEYFDVKSSYNTIINHINKKGDNN